MSKFNTVSISVGDKSFEIPYSSVETERRIYDGNRLSNIKYNSGLFKTETKYTYKNNLLKEVISTKNMNIPDKSKKILNPALAKNVNNKSDTEKTIFDYDNKGNLVRLHRYDNDVLTYDETWTEIEGVNVHTITDITDKVKKVSVYKSISTKPISEENYLNGILQSSKKYNKDGKIVEEFNGYHTLYKYDNQNRIASIHKYDDKNNHSTKYLRDDNGRVRKIINYIDGKKILSEILKYKDNSIYDYDSYIEDDIYLKSFTVNKNGNRYNIKKYKDKYSQSGNSVEEITTDEMDEMGLPKQDPEYKCKMTKDTFEYHNKDIRYYLDKNKLSAELFYDNYKYTFKVFTIQSGCAGYFNITSFDNDGNFASKVSYTFKFDGADAINKNKYLELINYIADDKLKINDTMKTMQDIYSTYC